MEELFTENKEVKLRRNMDSGLSVNGLFNPVVTRLQKVVGTSNPTALLKNENGSFAENKEDSQGVVTNSLPWLMY